MPAAASRTWDAVLDVLEARVAAEEQSLAAGGVAAGFLAVELPEQPLRGAQRLRAELVLGRVSALTEQYRGLVRSTGASAGRPVSPYR